MPIAMRTLVVWMERFLTNWRRDCEMRRAVKAWDVERIKSLVSDGFDLNRAIRGTTLLQRAIASGDRPMIDFLLARGATIPRSPWTIWSAINHRNFDIVQLAIEQGLDVNAAPRRCQSPLELAMENHDIEAIRFLVEHGADERSLRHTWWHRVSPEVAHVLASYGLPVYPVAFL